MPVREGKIVCSNCHNPHGSATEALLREYSINDNCYKCHAEKRGPFLFEHAPVRENCLSYPHGTTNEYLLKVSRPRLCAECHGFNHGSLTKGPFSKQLAQPTAEAWTPVCCPRSNPCCVTLTCV
jgi:DmsE family decaheme c-type cytochrome